MGETYAATPEAIPPGPQYVALGHIHAPQKVPGARVPAEYAGSLLELDFGEAGEQKRVVVVDAEPGLPATVSSVPLTAGRRLLRPSGEWAEILGMDGVHDAYLDLTVETAGPDPGLAERARAEFDYLVKVRAEYDRPETERVERAGRSLNDLSRAYYEDRHGVAPPDALLTAFDEVSEEVAAAPP
jgi:exonuclease SbcD